MDEILKYFPILTNHQIEQFSAMKSIYEDWNSKINVISRKDMDNFYIHHVLHSLAIAKLVTFVPGTRIIDIGTGGGFPGIPLAVLFPSVSFTLLDSVGKKIKVVREASLELGLTNVNPLQLRAEEHKIRYDFVLSRAVMAFPDFYNITSKSILSGGKNAISNGIIYLKGGDLTGELADFGHRVTITDIKDFFSEPFFETKRIVYLPL